MTKPNMLTRLKGWARGLSARILVLTIFFVMAVEVLVFFPSLANYWRDYLNQRLDSALLAALARDAAVDHMVDPEIETQLLRIAGVRVVVLQQEDSRELIFSDNQPLSLDASYNLRTATLVDRMFGAYGTLSRGGEGTLQVISSVQKMPGEFVEIILDERDVYNSMLRFAQNIFVLSLIISLVTAALVYLALHMLIVRPMRRLTTAIQHFRDDPENPKAVMDSWHRRDEIGIAQCELSRMQAEVRQSLNERARLANLGAAVARINHDLRGILANLQLASDGLARSEDPKVQMLTPRIMRAVDRGIRLCRDTLTYGKASEPPPIKRQTNIHGLIEEAAMLLNLDSLPGVTWRNDVSPDLALPIDSDQIFRVFLNLMRNGAQAVEGRGEIGAKARLDGDMAVIEICDTGPGIPERAQADLFKPFMRSSKADGSGLGLAIAAELVRAHGGQITLAKSDSEGSVFAITLPV